MKPAISLAADLMLDLQKDCGTYSRPEIRRATLDRLVEACDALERGGADPVIANGRAFISAGGSKVVINPSTVERYVIARRETDDTWTGPKRVTIQKDPGLKAYVDAREAERTSRPRWNARASKHQVEDILSAIKPVENAQLLRQRIAEGDLAKRRLDDVSAGLKKMDVDIDVLRKGNFATSNSLSERDKFNLRQLVERLSDERLLGSLGLLLDSGYIREAEGLGTILVEPEELALLRRLCGVLAD